MASNSVKSVVVKEEKIEVPSKDEIPRDDIKSDALQRDDELEEEIIEVRKGAKGIYSQGLINISLLSSNATQLRTVQLNSQLKFHTTMISLIITSIGIQTVILLLLFALTIIPKPKYSQNKSCFAWKRLQRNRGLFKSMILFFVSILTAVNIFISAYHVE